jgi:urocanate hydratase
VTEDTHPGDSILLSQRLTLRAYTVFALQAAKGATLGGKLLVFSGFGREGIAAALGAMLAGAACLGIDPDPQLVKLAMREGGCDFMVNSLDEALRILKNEVRKQRSVSVGVPVSDSGGAAQVLASLVQRGVQPDLLTDFLLSPPAAVPDAADEDASDTTAAQILAMQSLAARGATLLDLSGRLAGWLPTGVISAQHLEKQFAQRSGYELFHHQAKSATALHKFDEAALNLLPLDDRLRRRWIEQAPKYFRRQIPERWLWVTAEERAKLV